MKLLIIENDQVLSENFLKHAKRRRFSCESARDYKQGLQKITAHDYDCIVINQTIHGGDGFKLLKILRENRTTAGIILTSETDSLEDRLRGFEQGADDFIVKPFHLTELLARIKAIVRRKAYGGEEKLIFKDLTIHIDARQLYAKDKPIKLTKKEFDILLFLARNKNRVVSKDSITDHTWGDHMDRAVSFDFIYAHVKNLRKKLEENGCEGYLKTVYGSGYKFIA